LLRGFGLLPDFFLICIKPNLFQMAKKFISTLSIVFAIAFGLKVQAQELTGKAANDRIAGTSRIVLKENN